jgi:hypothetical protein
MSKKKWKIGNIKLKKHRATHLDFRALYTWTIWQFPRKIQSGLCGAVHPPDSEHGWFPAVIIVKEKKAQVYAHLDQTFDSPEEAAKFLET